MQQAALLTPANQTKFAVCKFNSYAMLRKHTHANTLTATPLWLCLAGSGAGAAGDFRAAE
jgi:hypothetical protein